MEQAFTSLRTGDPHRLDVIVRDDEVLVQSPAAQAERLRNRIRALAALAAVTGLVMAPLHMGMLALIPAATAAASLAPSLIRQRTLFRLLKRPDQRIVTPLAEIPVHSVTSIEGRYGTSGWDGRTCITAVLADGETVPLLEIPGADDSIAKAVCEALAQICRCGAEYTGPFGQVIRFGDSG